MPPPESSRSPHRRDTFFDRLLLCAAFSLAALSGCGDAARPVIDIPEPSPGRLVVGSIPAEERLPASLTNVEVRSTLGGVPLQADGSFAIRVDHGAAWQPLVAKIAAGPPIFLGCVAPESAQVSLGARSTIKFLVETDPHLIALPDPDRRAAAEAVANAADMETGLIRGAVAAGDFHYLTNFYRVSLQTRLASRLRALAGGADTAGTILPPLLLWGDAGTDSPVIRNPYTIEYGCTMREYHSGAEAGSFLVARAALPRPGEPVSSTATRFPSSSGRYRVLIGNGREAGETRGAEIEETAFRRNLCFLVERHARDALHLSGAVSIADSIFNNWEDWEGAADLRRVVLDGDAAALFEAIDLLLEEHASVLLPGVDPSTAGLLKSVAATYRHAALGMSRGRFLTDLLGAPSGEEFYVRVNGRATYAIDHPTHLRPPTSLIASSSAGTVRLAWADHANNELGYVIERAVRGPFVEIGRSGEDSPSFEDSRVTPMTWYEYRVRAYNQSAVSEPSNTVTIGIAEDRIPPSPVRILNAFALSSSQLQLSWECVGDDGMLGTAATYDIRYAKEMLSELNWEEATEIIGEPWPRSAGNYQSHIVGGLEGGQMYCFAMKVIDDAGNVSELSSVACETTPLPGYDSWISGFGRPPQENGLDGAVFALCVHDGDLIAGGNFTNAGRVHAEHIARWDGQTWSPMGAGVDGYVRALAVYKGDLIVGGIFRRSGSTAVNSIARWSGTEWLPLGDGVDGDVECLGVLGDELYVGGRIGSAGGVPLHGIARWDGARWDSVGSGVNNGVFVVAPYEGKLIAGGDFGMAGGVAGTSEIASWDGSSWSPLGGGMDVDFVDDVVAYGGRLVAGGQFMHAGGIPVSNIAGWDGVSWHPLGRGMNSWVHAFSLYREDLIAGGAFSTAGGRAAQSIARWDGGQWTPFGQGINGPVRALAVFDESLVAGGWFTGAGTVPSSYIAFWRTGGLEKPRSPDSAGR